MNERAHKIQQQSIEIEFAGIDDAVGIQERIAELFYSRLQPGMETLFDEVAGDHHLISVDRLEIDCGLLSNKGWEEEWVHSTLRTLKTELLSLPRKLLNGERNGEDAFLFFLQYGHLPWNCSASSVGELQELIKPGTAFVNQLKLLISGNDGVIHRLIATSSHLFLEKLVEAFTKGDANDVEMMRTIVIESGSGQNFSDDLILKVFSEEKENRMLYLMQDLYSRSEGATKKKIETIALNQLGIDPGQLVEKKNEASKGELPGAIYLRNARLVLLHPFLPRLLEITGLRQQNAWVDRRSKWTAVRILNHLVTNVDEFEEHACPLNKILCGLQPTDVAENVGVLPNEIKDAGELMISEIIGYWAALKNTGSAAFRETFLQRPGKLSRIDNGWLLQVERRSTDVLLDYLPWGIGIIKLPWMTDILYVEWT